MPSQHRCPICPAGRWQQERRDFQRQFRSDLEARRFYRGVPGLPRLPLDYLRFGDPDAIDSSPQVLPRPPPTMAAVDPLPADGPSVTLTIRLIMQGKEVGSIIGKDLQNTTAGINVPKPPVTLRLIVPASQCGSLIGKGGSKIKEIREVTGASIQVASEMLPNSTERAVTLSGTAEAISKCIYQICCVMMESPPKGATIPYRPKPAMPPVIFAGGQAYTVQGQYAIPHPDCQGVELMNPQHAPLLPGHSVGTLSPQGSLCIPALATLAATNSLRPGTAATALASVTTTTTEMNIPNDLIGCVIGKGGAKINEIRQLSGATIKISNSEEGSKDRTVAISGTPEAINLAQYLINTSMDLHKNLDLTSNPSSTSANTMSITNTPLAIPINQLVKASPLTLGLSSAAAAAAAAAAANQTTLFDLQTAITNRKSLTTKLRATATHNGNKKTERNKFSPY
ncbi:poly(rC)-binding protein 3 [Trichonephila inaurata madagascariensis]|uniref:Poly(RC)-binding protein 3 n=1 Tax=Trichonephila inaurata madagascariensis TaxID=2747483 RepID=A0A8X7BW54_9ARAC|nr:poly(rC)-binding protein 3 [Trichonephila inaurata madagascariensis]